MTHQPLPVGLRCEVEPDRDRVIVRPVGEIDLATVAAVETPLQELWDAGFTIVILDLRSVPFMDSTGLRMLVRQAREAEGEGRSLRIRVTSGGEVHRLLELTGMLAHLPINLEGTTGDQRPRWVGQLS